MYFTDSLEFTQVRTINYDEKGGYGTMNNFRQYALCIGTSVLILLVSGCSGVFDTLKIQKKHKSKELCENVRYVPN